MITSAPSPAQSWTKVTNTITGSAGAGAALLLTDGTVLVHQSCTPNWYKLTPDNTGSYINGTWSAAIPMQSTHGPLYFASAVLPDGRVVASGGEYNTSSCASNTAVDTNLTDIYNPATNSWSVVTPPFSPKVGDASSVVLANGKLMVANQFGSNAALLDPVALTWTTLTFSGKADANSEEGWTLLATNKVLTVDAQNGTNSELYDSTSGTWSGTGSTIVAIPSAGGLPIVPEVGPAVLRPNGTVFQAGSSGHNAVYTVGSGTWVAAPDFPLIGGQQQVVADGPAALLPSGNVLVIASSFFTLSSNGNPAHNFEWDGTNLNQITATPPNLGNDGAFQTRLLLLPTGQVLFTDGTSDVEVYTPASTAPGSPAWMPTITTFPSGVAPGTTVTLFGTQLNGLSQANAYGDDAQSATNYPVVRVTNTGSGHVRYWKTHDHSTMGVATGSAVVVSTSVDVPSNVEVGPSTLVVVANGIPSIPVSVDVTAATTLTNSGPTTDEYSDPVTVSATLTSGGSGGSPVAGKTITFKLNGTETCTGVTNTSGVASCSITPLETPGTYTLAESFAGDTSYLASSASVPFTVNKENSLTTYTGVTTSDYHDAFVASATLKDKDDNSIILSGKTVVFVLGAGTGTETCSAVTNSAAVASCTLTPIEAAGSSYTLSATFAGDTFVLGSSASTTFVITKEQDTVAFTATSPTVIANGNNTTFSATLKEDGVTPIAGRSLTIKLGTGGSAQTCTATPTDATGTASCSILVNQPLGPNTVTVNFAGDGFYLPSSATESVILFSFLASGSMMIGNLNDAVGTPVEFWGSDWSTQNALSGGPAPDAFKGFADTAPHVCGGTWSTLPGNSSIPPATLPSYMGVLASNAIGQSGSSIAGNDPVIVVVMTNPGYAPDPGHPGTGTVVATFCH
jgi:hypothetical protein